MRLLVRAVLLLAGPAIVGGGVAAHAIAPGSRLSTRVAPTAVEVFAPEPTRTARGLHSVRLNPLDLAFSTLAGTVP